MKYLAIIGVVAVVGVGVWFLNSKEVTYIKETEVVTETVEVDALEQEIKNAQDAKKGEIEAIAKKAYDEAYHQEMRKVELQVIQDFDRRLEVRQEELENEISL